MTEGANHWKLGLFVVLGGALAIVALTFLGTLSLRDTGLVYFSYFDEAVTGLETGAVVKFRGVTIGSVREIAIAPDRVHVEVRYELDAATTHHLGWSNGTREKPSFDIPRDLRAQLESVGVSPVKYIQLDHVDPERFPVPELPFDPPPNTIPSAPSTFKSLEEALVVFAGTMPEVAERSLAVLERLHMLLSDLQKQQLPAQIAGTLEDIRRTLATMDGKIDEIPIKRLSAQVGTSAEELTATLRRAQQVLASFEGDRGVLASVQRASDRVGQVAGGARGIGDDLGAALRDFRELVVTLQRFVEALERDPDMLLKGRAELEP